MSRFDRLLRQLTLANQLTLLRLVAVPALALALLSGRPGLALGIYVGAAITDRLDGIAARRLGQQTTLGVFLDPAADKAMMLTTYVILALPNGPRPFPEFFLEHHVPAWLTVLVVARDLLIVVVSAALYMAYSVRSFQPRRLGKWATASEMCVGGVFLAANVWAWVPDIVLDLGCIVVLVLLVASGFNYLFTIRQLVGEHEETP